MALLREFLSVEGWTIHEWDPDPSLGLGAASFLPGSRLLVAQVPASPPDLQICALAWLNQDYNLCIVQAIPFDPKSGSLKGEVLIHIPAQGSVFCRLTLTLSQVVLGGLTTLHLRGRFEDAGKKTGGTGGPGTLAAEASAGSGAD